MKKALSAAMAAGMTAVMLAGCGSSASSAAESTAPAESTSAASTEAAAESVVSAPTALSFVFADGDDNFKTEMNKIVDNFNAANPDITITIEPGDGGSYSEFLKTKDSVGEFPDMMELDKQYPQYQLAKHKGYPTKLHYELIEQYGIQPFYRRSFLKKQGYWPEGK